MFVSNSVIYIPELHLTGELLYLNYCLQSMDTKLESSQSTTLYSFPLEGLFTRFKQITSDAGRTILTKPLPKLMYGFYF